MSRKTPNQIVAFNLRRARLEEGWTQQQTADALGISRANYSLIEGSFGRDSRIRNFTADDLFVYSELFDLPVLWFLLPPISSDEDSDDLEVVMGDRSLDVMGYLRRVMPDFDFVSLVDPDSKTAAMENRLAELEGVLDLPITRRINSIMGPMVARGLDKAVPELALLIQTLDEQILRIARTQEVLRKVLAEPAWAAGNAIVAAEFETYLEKAFTVEIPEGGEEE